jgi:hypothetical protein
MEVDMGKHIEFGKDLGLIAEVVRRGLSIGIGHWEFWEALSKPQPGLWSEMLQFEKYATPEYIGQRGTWPRSVPKTHHRAPDVDTLDQVVRQGRQHSFEKTEWQRLAEDGEFFSAMVEYLRLAPPFSTVIEVDYDHIPPYRDGYTPCGFPKTAKSGVLQREMSIYVPGERVSVLAIDTMLRQNDWGFADQNELYAFGQATKKNVRPWALVGVKPILGLGTCGDDRAGGYMSFPKLWTMRGEYNLDLGACSVQEAGISDGDHLLVVKN